MRNKRIWQADKVSLGSTVVRCSEDVGAGTVLAVTYMVTPLDTRRIDYDPWRIVLHLSRMMDALEGVD